MSTFTVSATHTITYVTTKMLLTIKEIIREIGLDPARLCNDWPSYELAISTWLSSRHLQCVILEIYNSTTGELVKRWDIDVVYATVGEGVLWVDINEIRYFIAKAGLVPASCSYDLKVKNSPGRPDVPGWGPCELRSTEGFRRYSIGATLGGNELTAQTSYWSC
jgi:hypothetical protein